MKLKILKRKFQELGGNAKVKGGFGVIGIQWSTKNMVAWYRGNGWSSNLNWGTTLKTFRRSTSCFLWRFPV